MPLLNQVRHYQRKIGRNKEHTEMLIYCISKLQQLPITVWHLEKTGIGKTISSLRKLDGNVGNVARALVWKWKQMVIADAAAEDPAKKDLKSPTVSNSYNNFLSSLSAEEEERQRHLHRNTSSSINHASEVLNKVYELKNISSAVNKNFNVLKYGNDHCGVIYPVTEKDNIHLSAESARDIHILDKCSLKDKKDSHCHHRHQSSKHHTCGKMDKTKNNKKGNEAIESKLRIEKIKLEKVDTKLDNKKEEKKSEISATSSKYKRHNKRVENKSKTSESKHYHKGQKRNSDLGEQCNENFLKKAKCSQKATIADDSIDYFAATLRMGDTVKNKLSNTIANNNNKQNLGSGSSSVFKMPNNPFSSATEMFTKLSHSLTNVKLEHLEVETDLAYALPEMSSNYNPLPHLHLIEENSAFNKEANEVYLSKQYRRRMKVYSGVNAKRAIPTLYDLCVQALKENIFALEYTGGVPYTILKPVLQQATPEQLFQVEYYNSYLIEDTDELWELHCQKEFHSGQRQPLESAREMYLRCLDEREAKLKALTSNIQESLTKSQEVRQLKLAFLDGDPKPPRNVAKMHPKCGAAIIPKSNGAKCKRSELFPNSLTLKSKFSGLKSSVKQTARAKPRMAPLMQKTLKFVKSFRR